jgi:hypothetical protein
LQLLLQISRQDFKVDEIYPYKINVFPEDEFLFSYVTDRLTVSKSTGASNGKGISLDETLAL